MRVQRPAGACDKVQPVREAHAKTLCTGPGNHDAIVCAQPQRRRDKAHPTLRREFFQHLTDWHIGRNTPSYHQGSRCIYPIQRIADAVIEAFDHRQLERRSNIFNLILTRFMRAQNGAFQASKGEMRFIRALQRPWQGHVVGVTDGGSAFDGWPAGKAETQDFCGFVNRLTHGIIDGGCQAVIITNAVDAQ
jgi:hypothetical protein